MLGTKLLKTKFSQWCLHFLYIHELTKYISTSINMVVVDSVTWIKRNYVCIWECAWWIFLIPWCSWSNSLLTSMSISWCLYGYFNINCNNKLLWDIMSMQVTYWMWITLHCQTRQILTYVSGVWIQNIAGCEHSSVSQHCYITI